MKTIKAKTIHTILAIAVAAMLSTSCAHAAPAFEYKVVQLNPGRNGGLSAEQIETLLNQLAPDGWEFVEVTHYWSIIFKRKK